MGGARVRGHVEESETAQRLRELREAARRFVGHSLVTWVAVEQAETELARAAIAYAATLPRPRKRSTLTKGPAK